VINDRKELKALREYISIYIPLYIRTKLIKTLYKSLEYRHVCIDKIVRRLAKIFTIPRLRAKLMRELYKELSMRIYSIFYKKLLELVPLDTKLVIDIELKDDEYKVEKIKNL
ncbi:hypothetical protein COCSADRAFT_346105, partial [Bipolaris sorokiniana ND90Pr]